MATLSDGGGDDDRLTRWRTVRRKRATRYNVTIGNHSIHYSHHHRRRRHHRPLASHAKGDRIDWRGTQSWASSRANHRDSGRGRRRCNGVVDCSGCGDGQWSSCGYSMTRTRRRTILMVRMLNDY